jgi:osmotically-inducible protein OsmY
MRGCADARMRGCADARMRGCADARMRGSLGALGLAVLIQCLAVAPVQAAPQEQPTDFEINSAVDRKLLHDSSVPGNDIDVGTEHGIVLFPGTVPNILAKERATTIAESVKGVRSVVNNLTVKAVSRTNHDIRMDVEAALLYDPATDAYEVTPRVNDGVVTLTGTVGSAAEKTSAYWDAFVANVTSVDYSGLNVEPWMKDRMQKSTKFAIKSDEDIQKAVNDALLFDPRVFSFNPMVTVRHGIVMLTGTVDNLKAKRAAEQDTNNTTGVLRVKNFLRVRGENPPPNDKLAQNVKDALRRDPYTDRYEITVAAINGVVYLTGTVDSYYEKTHAEDVASRVNGVIMVNDGLLVSYPAYTYYSWPYTPYFYEPYYYNRPAVYSTWPYINDAVVQAGIEDELFWSPFVDRDKVKVAVKNGVATLTGTVNSWSEYYSATENALEGGARSVINDLKVK